MFNRLKYSGSVKRVLDKIQENFSHLFKVTTFAGHRINFSRSIDEIRPYTSIFDLILVCTYDFPSKNFDKWLSPIHWLVENIEFYKKAADQLGVP